MSFEQRFRHAVAACAVLLPAVVCPAQELPPDHTCTIYAGGSHTSPAGKDGTNFQAGPGFLAGGGFAVTRLPEPRHGAALFLTVNYMYSQLELSSDALTAVKKQLTAATGGHGSFSAVTFDPTLRIPLSKNFSVYLLGGFGWFRRGVGIGGPDPGTLTESSAPTLERLHANSGAFDAGGGFNIGFQRLKGVMVFAEARVYRGLAVNSGTTVVPVSFGIRW